MVPFWLLLFPKRIQYIKVTICQLFMTFNFSKCEKLQRLLKKKKKVLC